MGKKFSEIQPVKLKQKTLFTIGVQPGPPGPLGPQNPAMQPATPSRGGEKWVLEKIKYFDPIYDQKTTVIGNPMEHAGKNIYFRDVHMLVNRVKYITIIKKDKLVQDNFYTCFKNKTLYWWNSVLFPRQKRLMKFEKNVNEWEQAFFKHWEKIPFAVMVTIKNNQYTMENAQKHENLWNSFWQLPERSKQRICLCIIELL